MMTSFCCATINGVYVGKYSVLGENKDQAAALALNAVLVQCDPNSAQWFMAAAKRKLLSVHRVIDVQGEEIDA